MDKTQDTNTAVGVVGATGDLGGQMCIQLLRHGYKVYGFSRKEQPHVSATRGTDLVSSYDTANKHILWTSSLKEIFHTCTIVHWCAPASTLPADQLLDCDATIILHDSVMNGSVNAANIAKPRRYAIAHCLMNKEAMVVLNNEYGEFTTAQKHFVNIGMNTHYLTTLQHDTMMAHSQAPFAILCKLLIPKLAAYAEQGLLTSSGRALQKALEDRSAKWTTETFNTILTNPELPVLLQEMRNTLPKV